MLLAQTLKLELFTNLLTLMPSKLMTNDRCAWLRRVVTFAQEMTPNEYESWSKNFDEMQTAMLKKVIWEEYPKMDLSQQLDKYYEQYQDNEDFILRLAVILYEFREKNEAKFDEFVKKHADNTLI